MPTERLAFLVAAVAIAMAILIAGPVSIPFDGAWAPFHTDKFRLNYFAWN